MEQVYRSVARVALKAGVNVRTVERSLRRVGASKRQAQRIISEVKRGV